MLDKVDKTILAELGRNASISWLLRHRIGRVDTTTVETSIVAAMIANVISKVEL